MTAEPLSNIDTAWLRLESPLQPMMITVVMVFGPSLDLERLKGVFRRRLLRFRRFRRRVVKPPHSSGRPYWDDDPDFDLDFHLKSICLKPPGDEAALRDQVSELMSSQLDFSRPLWQFHLIEKYGEGWALVGRVHHCLADGPALLHVLSKLAGDCHPEDGPDAAEDGTQASRGRSRPAVAFSATVRASETLSKHGVTVLRNPSHLLSLARLGSGSVRALSRLLFRPQDPKTAFRGKLGSAKRVAWSAPVALADVKSIGCIAGGTVNDVMLAATTGALRRYLQSRGEPVDGLTIRAGLSVSLRSPKTEPKLGNQAGALLVPLPVGLGDPLKRLFQVKSTMDSLKESPEGTIIYGLLQALGMAPADTQAALVESYCTRETAMVANVPGPARTIYLAGAPLDTLLFWIPSFGGVGLNLNIVSYAGQIRLGVATDKGLVPDPERIVAEFHVELEALQGLAGKLEDGEAKGLGGENPIEVMNALLDEALRTMDKMLEPGRIAQRTQAPGLTVDCSLSANPYLTRYRLPLDEATGGRRVRRKKEGDPAEEQDHL